MGTRQNGETGAFIKMLVQRVKQISQQGFICLTLSSNAHLRQLKGKNRSHRSCSISLFCFFHCSLKSVENSCQTEKKVLRPTSFSPAFGLTEKDTVNSKKLRREKKEVRTGGQPRETIKPFQLFWQSTNVHVALMHTVSSLIVVQSFKHKPALTALL